jgi:hypothetical protein
VSVFVDLHSCLCQSPATVALRGEGRARRAGTTWMKRHKRTPTDKNGEELSTKSIALSQELTRLAHSAAVASTG